MGSLIVSAIPRGGAVTGEVISRSLGACPDLVVAKKVGDPLNPEYATGVVMHDGSFVPNQDVVDSLDLLQQYIEDSVFCIKERDR